MKAKFVLLGCAGSILLCLGACGLGTFIFTKRAGDGYTSEIKQAKKDGLPTTAEVFSPAIDPGKNSAPALLAAAKSVRDQVGDLAKKAKEPQKSVLQLSSRGWSRTVAANDSILQPAVAKLKPSLDKAVRATKMPGFRFNRDYSRGFDLLFPEYADFKTLTRWLSVRAILRANSGDDAGMAEDLTALAKISAACGSDDFLIGFLVQVATESITLQTMEQCLTEAKGRPGTIRAVRQAMKAFAPVPNVKEALRGEYFLSMMSMQKLIKNRNPKDLEMMTSYGQESDNSSRMFSELMLTQGLLESNAANFLRITRENYLALPTDPLDLTKAKAVFAATDKKLDAEANNIHYVFARIMAPVFANASEAFVRSAQQRRLLEVLVVSLQERNRTGRLPAKLPVKGALATDLFDGGNLRYSLVDGKLKIYSVGIDGFDNGGAQQTDGNTKDIDIVVSFPR